MSFTGYLSAAELSELTKALVDARLVKPDAQDAMRSAILPAFQAMLPISGTPLVQLTLTLREINRVHNLVNGDVPLEQFLEVAALLASGLPQASVIGRALDKIRYDTAPPVAASVSAVLGTGATDGGFNTTVTPEAQTGAMDHTVSVRFLRDGLEAARSVVKLLVHRHMSGHPEFVEGDQPRLVSGTGWVIAPGLLITNHHVIEARRKEGGIEPDATPVDFQLQAENTRVAFDFVNDSEPSWVLTGPGALLHSDQALDFALLRVPVAVAARPPLRLRSHAMRKTLQQAFGMGVNVLQHPNGKPMRLGFRNNYITVGDDRSLSYLTDTDYGSSGSPVFDDAWKVAALHSGSRAISVDDIVILGQRYVRENHGIPMAAILAHLDAHRPDLKAEIAAGQSLAGLTPGA